MLYLVWRRVRLRRAVCPFGFRLLFGVGLRLRLHRRRALLRRVDLLVALVIALNGVLLVVGVIDEERAVKLEGPRRGTSGSDDGRTTRCDGVNGLATLNVH